MTQEKRPLIALDFPTFEAMKDFLGKFPEDEKLFVKIGMELYYAQGPRVISYVKSLGHSVFLDLKLHDIPNTVYRSMRVLAQMGVEMTNVHAAGGVEMMQAAKDGLRDGTVKGKEVPLLIAVTQLTSTSQEILNEDQNIQTSVQDSVVHYAKRTALAGLDGVVSSAQEVALIKNATSKAFICLTPGIRMAGGDHGDQKRVMTPQEARKIGSDYIVVGRPITQAKDPVDAYYQIYKAWNEAI
ncbi:orotidine-5'-phosphate decarboxylase [Lactococcus hircilactis]|uniref:orotidine-5'-phosphate decarboxylase n=1 Tax=Lactococcus hircilactis TaxID=1494462 RepID=UPI001B87F5CC|nr:orotidine-5'-phosphate decarboxylase [Lactococcus hircilactis]